MLGTMRRRHPNRFDLERLRRGLGSVRLFWYPHVRSTNDQAALLRQRGQLFAPAVVLGGRQTAGRGRGRNTWWSAPGCLTVTFVLPVEERLGVHQLPLVAGLATRQAAAELAAEPRIALKWPNDVVYAQGKLAGVLCERIGGVDLVGIGLNVNLEPQDAPPALRRRLTSLSQIAGGELDLTDALLALWRHLGQTMLRRRGYPFAAILREYERHHVLNGRHIRVAIDQRHFVEGVCRGIDGEGRLLVVSAGSVRRIVTGSVVEDGGSGGDCGDCL